MSGKGPYGKRLAEKGEKGRPFGAEDESLHKRHRTRHALSKRQLTDETVLYFTPKEGSDGEEDDSLEEAELVTTETHISVPTSIEIPVVRTLTDEELAARDAAPPLAAGEEEEPTSDEWYRKLHIVFEIKEQAFREQALRSGGARRLVQRSGREVSATELMLAPEVEKKLSREDHKLVLGKVDAPEVPDERLVEIQERLQEVAKSYEPEKRFARYFLHTRWKPSVVVSEVEDDNAAAAATGPTAEATPKKKKLVIKLRRLADQTMK
jgi:hypothetical protein